MPSDSEVVLHVEGVRKAYGPVEVLKSTTIDIRAGQCVGLLGRNGAGKSTLIKIITGVVAPTQGKVRRGGLELEPNPKRVMRAGIGSVQQDPQVVPGLTVAENIALGHGYPTSARIVRRRQLHARAGEVLASMGIDIETHRLGESLSASEVRLVGIARALYEDAEVVILDEPTATLHPRDVDRLLAVVERLRDAGKAVIYVTHRLDEIDRIADRIIVLRDGAVVADAPAAELAGDDLVSVISGPGPTARTQPSGEQHVPGRHAAADPGAAPALELRGIAGHGVGPVDLVAHRGEIVGIAGLVGSGRSRLLKMIAGVERPSRGVLLRDGARVRPGSIRSAQRSGIVLAPEERRREGLVTGFSVYQNATISSLGASAGWLRFLSKSSEIERTSTQIRELDLKTSSVTLPAERLSGGNQQKLIMARWFMRRADVLLCDEPTQGVDVRGKADIARILRQSAEGGTTVVVVSSDFTELIDLCDRIVAIREGDVVGELRGPEATDENITRLCFGRAHIAQ